VGHKEGPEHAGVPLDKEEQAVALGAGADAEAQGEGRVAGPGQARHHLHDRCLYTPEVAGEGLDLRL